MKLATASDWHIDDGLLYGADDFVAEWVNGVIDGTPRTPNGWHKSIGLLKVDRLAGGVIYHNPQPNDITMTVAIDRVFVTPKLLTRCLQYPFATLGLPRVSMEIPEGSRRSIRLAKVCGAHLEGRKHQGAPDDSNMLIFGIYASDYRFKESIHD